MEIGIMEFIHSNVFGPILVPSLGGSMYYVSLIHYFSSNTWLSFLEHKYEFFSKFKEFKLVQNQIYKKIKVIIIDNGGELCGKEFENFSKKCGIS
jgi:hypothetical protein